MNEDKTRQDKTRQDKTRHSNIPTLLELGLDFAVSEADYQCDEKTLEKLINDMLHRKPRT